MMSAYQARRDQMTPFAGLPRSTAPDGGPRDDDALIREMAAAGFSIQAVADALCRSYKSIANYGCREGIWFVRAPSPRPRRHTERDDSRVLSGAGHGNPIGCTSK